jgi:16S rRNA (guanine966-N2)-methyltransferase
MRVISGKYRGRVIESVSGKQLRPTMGMAREALFNILSHGRFADLLDGANVLDLFCGCGALAIEALSRGAGHAVLIDIDPKHLDIARKNIHAIGESGNTTFIRGDSSTPPPTTLPCNLIFVDPPYGKKLADISLKNLIQTGWLAQDAIIVVETSKVEDVNAPAGFTELDDRKYGNSRIRILQWDKDKA